MPSSLPRNQPSTVRKIDTQNFQRATRATSRQINRQIILNLVREHQPISRADLARRLAVARGVVTTLVGELISSGLLYEGESGSSPRGRRPTLLHVRTRDRLVIAIDVSMSGTQILLCDFSGQEIARETFDTPVCSNELTTELIARTRRVVRNHSALGRCEGIGLVVPGMVDQQTGKIAYAPTLGWRDVDLRGALEAGVAVPVHIERDALACALAQMWHEERNGAGLDSYVYVTVSDGVGTGLVVNGQLIRGHSGIAGEFGHIPLSLDGPRCLCGAQGCWEAYVSNSAVVARYLGIELSTRESYVQLREAGVTVNHLIARARSGDAAALTALKTGARYLGLGLAGIIKAFNPARIIVGGELMAAWDLVHGDVHTAFAERTLTDVAAATPIIPESSDGDARLLGAAALVTSRVFAAPKVA